MRLFSWWGAFCVTVVAALAVSILLGGCASRPPDQTTSPVTNSWGRCDHPRIATSQIFCRQTIAEPVAGPPR
jgi:ABC-type uncharacterized transport system auxiliary subunit